jgi:hypothetical protein
MAGVTFGAAELLSCERNSLRFWPFLTERRISIMFEIFARTREQFGSAKRHATTAIWRCLLISLARVRRA